MFQAEATAERPEGGRAGKPEARTEVSFKQKQGPDHTVESCRSW